MRRRTPLRTGRAAFTASGSSKPWLVGWREALRSAAGCAAGRPLVHSPTAEAVVSSLSVGWGVIVIVSGWAHLTTSARFRGRAPRPGIRPVIHDDRLEGTISCRGFPSPFGHRHSLLGHPVPAEGLGPPHGRLTGPDVRTSTGLPRSARTSCDRGGCPLYPGDDGAHPGLRIVLSRRLPLHGGTSLVPGSNTPPAEVPLDEASTRVQAIHPSGLPLTRHHPDGTTSGFGFPPSFAPRRPGAGQRTSRVGTGHRARTWNNALRHRPSLQSNVVHSWRATSRRTDRCDSLRP